jgi:hypothetical protein|tara:strand:+ start:3018 stop:3152 length:135 start_codon:yes stop_codon:yes gene_type:complete
MCTGPIIIWWNGVVVVPPRVDMSRPIIVIIPSRITPIRVVIIVV